MPPNILTGDALRQLLRTQITLHSDGLAAFLAPFDPVQVVTIWHATWRAVEEFINIPIFGFGTVEETLALGAVSLGDDFLRDPGPALRQVMPLLTRTFDAALAQRFVQTMLQCAALGSAYRLHGMTDMGYGLHLGTVGDAITYLQSRRRLLLALLY